TKRLPNCAVTSSSASAHTWRSASVGKGARPFPGCLCPMGESLLVCGHGFPSFYHLTATVVLSQSIGRRIRPGCIEIAGSLPDAHVVWAGLRAANRGKGID